MTNAYEKDLDRNPANYAPLTPIQFLERAAYVYPERIALVHGKLRQTWKETYARCRRLGSALARRGIGIGDTVAVMLPNIPAMYEAHFGVPMAGAVLNSLNTRLDADAIAFMLNHGEAKVLLTDREFSATIEAALAKVERKVVVIDVDDPEYSGGKLLGVENYEQLLAEGDPDWKYLLPSDEWQAIALNYTSGTTGNPKGVVYAHRGAYLNGYSSSRRSPSGMPTASSSSSARRRAASPRSFPCRSSTSVICRPTVSTGFSAVEGSWKIIATRRPRTSRIADSGSAKRSSSPSAARPSTMRAASGSRRSRDSAVIDLPQPDSPTSAKHSPARSSRSTASTARSGPCAVSIHVRSPVTESTASLTPSPPPGACRCGHAGRSRRAPRRRTGWPPAPART